MARGTAAWEGCWKSQEGPHRVPERFPPCLSLTLFLEGFPTSALWVWLLTSFIASVPAMSSDWPGMIEFGSGNSLMSKKTANVRKVSMIWSHCYNKILWAWCICIFVNTNIHIQIPFKRSGKMPIKLVRVVISGAWDWEREKGWLAFYLFCLNYITKKWSKSTFVLHGSVTSDKWLDTLSLSSLICNLRSFTCIKILGCKQPKPTQACVIIRTWDFYASRSQAGKRTGGLSPCLLTVGLLSSLSLKMYFSPPTFPMAARFMY